MLINNIQHEKSFLYKLNTPDKQVQLSLWVLLISLLLIRAFFIMENHVKWAVIPGYNNDYHISNTGRIKSFKHSKSGKLLAIIINKDGYIQSCLSLAGKRTNVLVHRLVGELYVENPLKLPEVNHLDGDKTNNNDWNIEWSTTKNNIIHAWKNGLVQVIYGYKGNAGKRLMVLKSTGEPLFICQSMAEAHRKTGVSLISIRKTCNGILTSTKNLIFNYV